MTTVQLVKHKPHPYIAVGCSKEDKLSVEVVVQTVYEFYKLNPLLAYKWGGSRKASHARQVCMYFLHILLRMTHTQITKEFNRKERTTVLKGIKTLVDQMQVNIDVRNDVNKLHDIITSNDKTINNAHNYLTT